MAEIRRVRRRAGAVSWELYEHVAHPEGFLEAWWMESWTDHLREEDRLSPGDRAALAKAVPFQTPGQPPARFIAVGPVRGPAPAEARLRVVPDADTRAGSAIVGRDDTQRLARSP